MKLRCGDNFPKASVSVAMYNHFARVQLSNTHNHFTFVLAVHESTCYKYVSSRRMLCVCCVLFEDYHLWLPSQCERQSSIAHACWAKINIGWVCTYFFVLLWTHCVGMQIFALLSVVQASAIFFASIQVRHRWWSILPIELLTESISFYFFPFSIESSKKESNLVWALTFLLFFLVFLSFSFIHLIMFGGCLDFLLSATSYCVQRLKMRLWHSTNMRICHFSTKNERK